MNLNSLLSIDSLPKLDLHGETCDFARIAINDYIKDCIILKHKFIVIVHGIGSGLLKKTTHETLKHNKNVKEFKTYYYNQGCTVVMLQI